MSAPTKAAPAAKGKRKIKSEVPIMTFHNPPIEVDGSVIHPWPVPAESLIAGRTWIGRSVRLSIQVEIPGRGDPSAIWATILICAKSFFPIGWHLHTDPPSIESLSMAIQKGVERIGRPDHILVDLLRDPRPDDLQHAESLGEFLGTEIKFKTTNTHTSKAIEREFLRYRHDIARTWIQFHASNFKEEAFKRIISIPNLEAFQLSAICIFAGLWPHRLLTHGSDFGKSRADVFREDCKEHGNPHAIGALQASQIHSVKVYCKIDSRGAHGPLECIWWGDWMTSYQGEHVLLSYDSFDMRTARVYATKNGCGDFLGTANLTHGAGWRVEK